MKTHEKPHVSHIKEDTKEEAKKNPKTEEVEDGVAASKKAAREKAFKENNKAADIKGSDPLKQSFGIPEKK